MVPFVEALGNYRSTDMMIFIIPRGHLSGEVKEKDEFRDLELHCGLEINFEEHQFTFKQ